MEQQQEVTGSRLIRVGSNDLKWPRKAAHKVSNFSGSPQLRTNRVA